MHFIGFAFELSQQIVAALLSVFETPSFSAECNFQVSPFHYTFFFNDLVFQSGLLFLLFLWQDNF